MLPYPFSTILFVWGDPIYVPRDARGEALERERLRAGADDDRPHGGSGQDGMWRLIYNLLVLAALPFFVPSPRTETKIRHNFAERLFPQRASERLKRAVWIHAASVGEAVVAENLIGFLRPRADNPFVITTNTYYTRDLLRRKLGGVGGRLLPALRPPFFHRALHGRLADFAALVLVETEIWPNLIWRPRAGAYPSLSSTAAFPTGPFGRYRRLAFFFKGLLSSVDLVIAQSEEHARRFMSLGMSPSRVVSTGNLKYYREPGRLPAAGAREEYCHLREHQGERASHPYSRHRGAEARVSATRGFSLRPRE